MENKRKKKKILVIIGVLLLCMVGTFGVLFFSKWMNKPISMDPLDLMKKDRYHVPTLERTDDEDQDGLDNITEAKLGTNLFYADTDQDGLTDYYEVKTSKTNPKIYDTDKDGLSDGQELLVGLDPLNIKTDGKTKDSDVKVERSYELYNCSLNIEGNASVTELYMNTCEFPGLKQTSGIIGDMYEFKMDQRFTKAKLSFDYSDYDLTQLGVDENSLAIYQFTDDKKFVLVESSRVDKERKTVTAQLDHFSRYVLADASCVGEEKIPEVFLLIDDSGSMYSEELCLDSDENDLEYKRVDFATKFITMCDEKIRFAAATFTADYMPIGDYSCSREELIQRIETIKTNTEHVFNGTYIASSGIQAVYDMVGDNSFTTVSKKRRFLILITDGMSTETGGETKEDLIQVAKANSVAIITIGIGNMIDTDYLTQIAQATGGIYCYSANADSLDTIYRQIISGINYNFIDSNEDGIEDRVIISDSGFKPEVHGISNANYNFVNDYGSASGQCYGFAGMSYLHYIGKLPLAMGDLEKHKSALLGDKIPYSEGYDLSNIEFFQSESEYANSKQNLCNYENKTLSMIDEIYEIGFYDRYELDGDTLRFPKETKKLLKDYQLIGIYTYESDETYAFGDKTYKNYEYLKVDLAGIDINELSSETRKDYEFFLAVNRLYSSQGKDNTIFEECYEIPSIDLEDEGMLINFFEVVNRLGAGEPMLVTSKGHAINAISIARDLENPMIYYLKVYDNNAPKEEKELVIKFTKGAQDFWDKLSVTEKFNTYWAYVYDIDGIFTNGISHDASELGRDVIKKDGASKCLVELTFSTVIK